MGHARTRASPDRHTWTGMSYSLPSASQISGKLRQGKRGIGPESIRVERDPRRGDGFVFPGIRSSVPASLIRNRIGCFRLEGGMALDTGTKLGPYELSEALGVGGMGEVYRARDTRLGRDVAVKVLPQSFACDADRLRRFEQEARTVATLNHPNIVAIFDVGEYSGTGYLVSELLEGETLRDKLNAGPLTTRRSIAYGSQVAEGLAAAHEKGIIHRDLKPENIFVTRDGRVKILDFGLAKLNGAAAPLGVTSPGATQTTPGVVLGTVGYMSPEQIRGRQVDARADIFSLGAILYEMLSGQRAFAGETSVETMHSILKDDPPDLDTAKLQVSPGLDRIVHRCLEKEPEHRFQSARDLKFAMEALSGSDSSAAAAGVPLSPRRPWLWPAIAAIFALIAITAIATAMSRTAAVPARVMHFSIAERGEVSQLAISPDGAMLAFVSPDDTSGKPMLFVQPIGSDTPTPLPGTLGAAYPFWSPDNQYVGFFAGGHLFKVRASGGPAQPLAAVTQSPRGGSWSEKGVIVYSPDAGGCLWRVNADGTGEAPLTEKLFAAGEVTHRWPLFLPDGEHVLFYGGDFQKERTDNGLYVTTLAAKDKRLVIPVAANAGFAQPDHLFYSDPSGRLFLREFDPDKQVTRGEPRVVLDHVSFQPSVLWAAFTVSQNGTVVANASSSAWRSLLTWYDRTGKELGTLGQPGILYNPSISPDGRRIAVDVADTQAANVNVWIHDAAAGTATRFTFGDNEDVESVWSPDGKQVAYRAFPSALVIKAASGLEKERVIVRPPSNGDDVLPNAWTADGRSLVCTVQSSRGGAQLFLVDVTDGKMTQLIPGKANHSHGQISPDGKWLAYASDESGAWEVYITTFPAAEGKWQVSQGGGTEPRWRGDGKELFYINANGMMTAVLVTTESGVSSGSPQQLFPVRGRAPISSTDLYSYDVTRDGRRFIVNKYQKPASIPPLEIVLNATK